MLTNEEVLRFRSLMTRDKENKKIIHSRITKDMWDWIPFVKQTFHPLFTLISWFIS